MGRGGGVGAGNLEFCGPQIALAYRLVLFHRGPQNSRFPAPTPSPPPPLPHVIYLPTSKTLRAGPYKSLVHRWFYEHENQCCGSESVSTGSTCFWVSWIRIHHSEVWIWIRIRIHSSEVWIRIRILLSPSKNSKKNLDSYFFLTLQYIIEK